MAPSSQRLEPPQKPGRFTAFSTIVPSPYRNLLALSREYQVAVAAQPTAAVSLISFEAYINATVLLEPLHRSPSSDRLSVMATLRSMRGLSIGGVNFSGPGAVTASGTNVADILMLTHGGRMLR